MRRKGWTTLLFLGLSLAFFFAEQFRWGLQSLLFLQGGLSSPARWLGALAPTMAWETSTSVGQLPQGARLLPQGPRLRCSSAHNVQRTLLRLRHLLGLLQMDSPGIYVVGFVDGALAGQSSSGGTVAERSSRFWAYST